jgi:hypothetical protein
MGRRAAGAPVRAVKFTMLFTKKERRDLNRVARVAGLTASDVIRQMIRTAAQGLDEGREGERVATRK